MGVLYVWLMLIFVGASVQAQVFNNSRSLTCNSRDSRVLQALLTEIEPVIDGWSTNPYSNCCKWVGITCNSSSSLGLNDTANSSWVVKVELPGRKLKGTLPESLGVLDQLRILNLSRNFLRGSLPVSLFRLPNLEVMDLSSNDFSGPVPSSFYLPSIQSLNISQNSLNGAVPAGVCGHSDVIKQIDFSMNTFSGSLPPGLGNCSSLEELWLGSNFVRGSLSDDLFRLQNLKQLVLRDNFFSGSLSSGIGNLSNLVRLDISLNGFSGRIPDVFVGFQNLQIFFGNSNDFTDQLPHSLSNSRTLAQLNLRNNSLSGLIDINCSAMTRLASLNLGSNKFYGPLPDNLSSCHLLNVLSVARNSLHGQVPESYKNFQSLSYLSLSNTSLLNISAALDVLQHCKNLTSIVLSLSFREEVMPSDPKLQFQKLEALIIGSCRLSGAIPQWLGSCTQLRLLDLSWNNLVGTIPGWFGNLESLFYLDLSNNSLTGDIPKSITGLACLTNRNILINSSSPNFPLFQKRNKSLKGMQYNQILSFPPTLDFSYNQLSGEILPEFGNLKRLHVLDLKVNRLSGSIPSNLSGMTSIETLDLSHNNLSGTIPYSLVNLSFLSTFSVAYNHLSGKTPSGGQFLTFPSSSFEGNVGLCVPNSICRSSDLVPLSIAGKTNRNKGIIIGMAFGIGLGTIFLVVLIFMIVLRTHSRKEVDTEEDKLDVNSKNLEEVRSKLVVLFQNKEINKELLVDDLVKASNNFDEANIIGCGGFGVVYKATLPDGEKVAIKRLSSECVQMEREFQAEVETLSRAQHANLVVLQGYCVYKNDRLLMYSFMENSSLDYWLHEKHDGASSLDWYTRLQIAQGVAKGLAYLHQSCEPHILHRDIKSSNILLNENFEAHLADFGLARLVLPYDTHVITDLVGTLGYIPPEYGQASVATYKGDVYSFGVVLLELLTGKRPMDMFKPKGSRDLVTWVIQMKEEKRESEVFDTFIYDEQHHNELLQVLDIAFLCLSESPKARPSTQLLVARLDNFAHDISPRKLLSKANDSVAPSPC